MGRQMRSGIDYFSLDCYPDDNLRIVQATYGLESFTIVIKLWQRIYRQEGYFMKWDQKAKLLFCMEENADKKLVDDTVECCFENGIFNKELFDKFEVLTSKGIQRRYLEATSRRSNVNMVYDYILLKVSSNVVIVNIEGLIVDVEGLNVYAGTQSKVKYSKVKYSKEYNTLINNIQVEMKIDKLSENEVILIDRLFGEHGPTLCTYALREAVVHNTLKFPYIATILESWKRTGVTEEDYENGDY